MTVSSVQQTNSMKNRFKRYSKNFTSREIFIKALMKGFTVPLVNPSGLSPSWWRENVLTVDGM